VLGRSDATPSEQIDTFGVDSLLTWSTSARRSRPPPVPSPCASPTRVATEQSPR